MATGITGASTTTKNPVADKRLPDTTTVLLPSFVISGSPFNLPAVIAIEKPA
jgi:hypothetical protein